jgi:hypothetical protein
MQKCHFFAHPKFGVGIFFPLLKNALGFGGGTSAFVDLNAKAAYIRA